MDSDRALHLLAENLRNARELAFIENLAKLLSELLAADHVMIAEVLEDAPSTANIVSFYSYGKLQNGGSYDLSGSPCEQVLSTDSCIYSDGVCEVFPRDLMLQELGASSYIGVPMLSADQKKLGLLAILNDKPTHYDDSVLHMLQVAAAQAAGELGQLRFSRSLQESQRRLQTLMNSLPGIAYRCKNDEFWTMEIVSRGAYALSGYKPQELIDNNKIAWAELIHPDDQAIVVETVTNAARRQQYFRVAYRIICADGNVRWVWEQGKGVSNEGGETTHFEGFILDVTEQHEHQERIEEVAFCDDLTGIANRAALFTFLQNAYEQSPEQNYLLTLLDLRHFRNVNERFGLHAGDRLLRIVAQRLQESFGHDHDIVKIARVTGDEFVVLLRSDEKKVEQFRTVVSHCQQLFDRPVLIGDHQLDVKLRFSGAYSYTAKSAADLLQQAGIAMHEAKQSGLNYCVFDSSLEQKVVAERNRTERFLKALANDELNVALQPQIDLKSGECVGAEVLCRWFDAELGSVPPAIFIDIARKQGVLVELGKQVLTKTCRLLATWRKNFAQVPQLSVNVGAQQFTSADVVEDFFRICANIDPRSVTFEITESDLMVDPELALTVTSRLRDYGFRLAIDDFGTGYSSLAYLQQFAVDVLKIDMSFVQAMIKDESSKTLVNTIIAMAHTLGLETIAEGIETAEQGELLEQLGCQFGQGFYFGRPVSPEEFAQLWLKQK